MIPQETIDRILSTVQIEEYISKDISLKPAGVNRTGCCPFHKEKTPSFSVSPAKGIFKCFGCGEGGNVIQYLQKRDNMTFPEAVKHLARQYNIAFEEREQTPAELEAQYLRESIYAANDAANKFFIAQLKQAEMPKKYVLSRWSEKIIDGAQIGYAPKEWSALKDHLLKQQFTKDVLFAAGLISTSEKALDYFDVFRDRITIPIRNKNGQIIGFTARIYKVADKEAKFINTKETVIFHKGSNLFGIHEAFREACRTDKIYLAEGAPDIIRLQGVGVANSVAPLGTALTNEQILQIKRCTKNVIIIPDADDAGMKAAVTNGKEMFRLGLNVTVVPLDEEKGKDADAQFQTIVDFQNVVDTNSQDFIMWWSSQVISGIVNESEKVSGIGEICDLLACSEDENIVDSYIESLSKTFKPRKIWTAKLTEARAKRQAATIKKVNKDENENFGKHGFFVKNNSYYGQTSRGAATKWSNFTMEPLAHVKGVNSKRLYRIKNEYGYEQVIEVKQEELVSLQKFRIRTESMGNFLWEGGEVELHRLKRFLYENTLTCEEITQLGWQKRCDFFAWGNGAFDGEKFIKVNDIGILNVGDRHFYLPAFSKIFDNDPQLFQFERKFVHVQTNGISLYDYSTQLISVFGDNAKIALCFLFATLFKDIVIRQTGAFPILNLFGPKGTGKSELGHSLTSFFSPKSTPPNINNTTIPALAEAVAQVSNSIVHIDEYKNTIEMDRREFLKGLWDGTGRTRMNMDRDKKRETTTVDCGVVLSGQEMPTADNALFSRLVFLTFSKCEFSEEERKTFEALKLVEKRGLTHITNEILRNRKAFEVSFPSEYIAASADMTARLDGYIIEDRTFKNWITVVATMRTIAPMLNIPFNAGDIADIATKGIVDQNSKTKQNNELSGWWSTVENLVRLNKVIVDVDFKIKSSMQSIPLVGYNNKVDVDVTKRYLLLQFNNIVPEYLKECRNTGAKQLPKDSLQYYLENSEEYVGKKKAERFKKLLYQNSTATKTVGISSDGGAKYACAVTTCMVFDYDMIAERYGISIDETYYNENDVDNE